MTVSHARCVNFKCNLPYAAWFGGFPHTGLVCAAEGENVAVLLWVCSTPGTPAPRLSWCRTGMSWGSCDNNTQSPEWEVQGDGLPSLPSPTLITPLPSLRETGASSGSCHNNAQRFQWEEQGDGLPSLPSPTLLNSPSPPSVKQEHPQAAVTTILREMCTPLPLIVSR